MPKQTAKTKSKPLPKSLEEMMGRKMPKNQVMRHVGKTIAKRGVSGFRGQAREDLPHPNIRRRKKKSTPKSNPRMRPLPRGVSGFRGQAREKSRERANN
jgi:hypothetical protein